MPLSSIYEWDEIEQPMEPSKTDVGPIPIPFKKLNRKAASQAALSGKNWHNNMLVMVGSWVAKGLDDEEIHTLGAAHTVEGYTAQETSSEVQKMIDGARSKGFDQKPNSLNHAFIPPPRQILSMIGDIEIKDPDYLINGIIETPALIGLIGPSGSGKTFVALDMAMSIATGIPYHEMQVTAGTVIMSAGEGHTGIPRRVQAWCSHYRQNIKRVNLALTRRAVNLFDEEYRNAFCREIETIALSKGEPKLIIIDTVARHMGGMDENSAKDMGELIRAADKLKDDYNCSVMLVHHTGHANQDRARGSTAFKGALDTEIVVNSLGDHDITVKCQKQKDGTPFDMRQFVKVSIEPSMVLQQVEVSRRASTKANPNEKLALETLKECLAGDTPLAKVPLEDWRKVFYERHTGDKLKSKEAAFRRARERLVFKNLVNCKSDFYSLNDSATYERQ